MIIQISQVTIIKSDKEWIKEKFVIGKDSLHVKGKGFTQKEKQFMHNKSKLARKLRNKLSVNIYTCL